MTDHGKDRQALLDQPVQLGGADGMSWLAGVPKPHCISVELRHWPRTDEAEPGPRE
jgi:hypothetical protein